jgi:hypothetical protein
MLELFSVSRQAKKARKNDQAIQCRVSFLWRNDRMRRNFLLLLPLEAYLLFMWTDLPVPFGMIFFLTASVRFSIIQTVRKIFITLKY